MRASTAPQGRQSDERLEQRGGDLRDDQGRGCQSMHRSNVSRFVYSQRHGGVTGFEGRQSLPPSSEAR